MSFGLIGGMIGSSIGSSLAAGTAYSALASQIGWTVGSMLFTALFQKGTELYQEGPRLGDSTYTFATYGAPIPKMYGSYRTAGNVIWMLPIAETRHEDRQESGKGGGGDSSTSVWYTYSGTWGVGICEGPIGAVSKIWLDTTLVYDGGKTGEVDLKETIIYYGNSDQDPDWRMEADHIDTPAYRGLTYIVFDTLQLEKFGNRLPSVSVEIGSGYITRVDPVQKTNWALTANNIAIGELNTGEKVYVGGLSDVELQKTYVYSDSYTTDIIYTSIGEICSGSDIFSYPLYNILAGIITSNGVNFFSYYNNKIYGSIKTTNTTCPYEHIELVNNVAIYTGDLHNFHTGDFGYIVIFEQDITGETYIIINDQSYFITSDTIVDRQVFAVDTDTAYICLRTTALSNTYYIYKYDAGIITYLFSKTSTYTSLKKAKVFSYFNNKISILEVNDDTVFDTILNTYDDLGAVISTITAITDVNTLPTNFNVFVSESNVITVIIPRSEYDALNVYGTQDPTEVYTILPLSNSDTSISLSDIVEDILIECGLESFDYDVTSGDVIMVKGYSRTRPMAGRNAIQPVLDATRYSLLEDSGKLKLESNIQPVTRYLTNEDIIGDAEIKIAQETELFKKITVTYSNQEFDYQSGSQHAIRINTLSTQENSVEIPIVLTNDEAKQLAEILLNINWVSRKAINFNTYIEIFNLVPNQVIVYTDEYGYTETYRIIKVTNIDTTKISVNAIAYNSTVYDSSATGSSVGSNSILLEAIGRSILYIEDLPTLSNYLISTECLYTTVGGASSNWSGASIGSQNFIGDSIKIEVNILENNAIGTTLSNSVLSDYVYTIIDNINTIDILLSTNYTLISVTDLALLKGANTAVIGDEIIQFKTAIRDPDTIGYSNLYRLSGLLRGRYGTEWSTGLHTTNERFSLLKTTNVSFIPESINSSKYYSATSLGNSLDTATDPYNLTYTGRNLKPLSPWYFKKLRETNNDITLQWMRRSRYVLGNLQQLPISENSEEYVIEVYKDSDTIPINTYIINIPTIINSINYYTYLEADQITDTVLNATTISFIVYQVSATVGNGYPSEKITIDGV